MNDYCFWLCTVLTHHVRMVLSMADSVRDGLEGDGCRQQR